MHSSLIKLSAIDSAIIDFTSSLYDPKCFASVTQEEMRDALSSGQLISKQWLLRQLSEIDHDIQRAVVVGGWVGLLATAIEYSNPSLTVDSVDLDEKATMVATSTMGKCKGDAILGNMYEMDYGPYQCVINTSAEHIPDVTEWISLLKPNTLVVVQSNNARHVPDHINCVDSHHELVEMLNLSTVYFAGELVFPMYTRYMVIGLTGAF